MTGRPYYLGLTGSVGMGKSTTAKMFAEEGFAVWDADAAVHRLYARGGKVAGAIGAIAADAVVDGAVDRGVLKTLIDADPGLLKRIEVVVHPLVAEDRGVFIEEHRSADLIVFDIPLLFETGADEWLDGVLVVSAPAEVQKERVLARPGMTEEMFERILARQMPDAEKRAYADFVISSAEGLEAARQDVRALIEQIGRERRNA